MTCLEHYEQEFVGELSATSYYHFSLSTIATRERRFSTKLLIFICIKDILISELAMMSPAVVVCRCSPTQKAAIVHLIKKHSNKPVAAIGVYDFLF